MAATQTQKEPKNLVHQNAILCETVGKELRNQKLYIRYTMNPHKKCKSIIVKRLSVKWFITLLCYGAVAYTLTGKPNSRHDSADGLGDGRSMYRPRHGHCSSLSYCVLLLNFSIANCVCC